MQIGTRELTYLLYGAINIVWFILSFSRPSTIINKRIEDELEPYPKKKKLYLMWSRAELFLMALANFVCIFVSSSLRMYLLLTAIILFIVFSLVCNKMTLGRLTISGSKKAFIWILIGFFLIAMLSSVIYIKHLPMPTNIAIEIGPTASTSPPHITTYLFEGKDTISCYNRPYHYNSESNDYEVNMDNPYWYPEECITTAKLNVFQKLKLLLISKNLSQVKLLYTTKQLSYELFGLSEADLPIFHTSYITMAIDGMRFSTTIAIPDEDSNLYACVCDTDFIDLVTTAIAYCPPPDEEDFPIHGWAQKHCGNIKRMESVK